MAETSNLQAFIESATKIHGDKFDYSESVYVNRRVPMVIICKKCNRKFSSSPATLTNAVYVEKYKLRDGCEFCDSKSRNSKIYFINKSQAIHGNDYDYSLVKEYEEAGAKVEIIHKECGLSFFQTKNGHTSGYKCPHCFCPKVRTKEEFIIDAKKIHGENYDYSDIKYIDTTVDVELGCNECGEKFWESPRRHLHSPKKNKTQVSRCPNCKDFTRNLTTEEFIKQAIERYGEKYDYSEVEYINTKSFIKIKCNGCGQKFEQSPNNHLNKRETNLGGCPECSFVNPSTESRGEKLIAKYLIDNNIEFVRQYTNKTCKYKSGNLLRFDFYIPNLNLLIEYDGLQHFKPVEFWGGVAALEELIIKDSIKNNWAIDNKIDLVRFRYDCFSVDILDNTIQEFIILKGI